jgi:xylan 1,4-beta-xylosidase
MSMAARLRMRWRVGSQSSERPVPPVRGRDMHSVKAFIGLLVLAVAAPAGHAAEKNLSLSTPLVRPPAAAASVPSTPATAALGTIALSTTPGPSSPTDATSPTPSQIAKPSPAVALNPAVYFKSFEYSGRDAVFEQPAGPGTYRNPVLAGFYPDPSITQVDGTFYLVNSTFAFFPGIPVFESRDLVHWRQIGNVIDRPRELNFDNKDVSRGIFAPSIRYNKGLFYVITTAVDAGGNEVFVAKNPAGPWSDPFLLPGLEGGIDPSLFFDYDGKAYVVNNGLPEGGPKYEGHRAIWIQEFDTASRRLIGPRKVLVNGGVDISKKPIWIEGPHLYHHGGGYILMCAEGGTSTQHSEVVLRSKSPWGPFKPYKGNPILTQRDLPADRPDPVINAGHADLVEAPDGSWWAVFLASRPYEQIHYNTGRETFMLPVTWRDGWPVILPQGKPIPYVVQAPRFPNAAPASSSNRPGEYVPTTGNFTWRDEFNSPVLRQQWLYVRTPVANWADLTQRPGWLTVHALHVPLESKQSMSFLAHRQQHLTYDASTELEVPAANAQVSVGMAVFQNQEYWFFLGIRRASSDKLQLFLEKRAGKQTETVASTEVSAAEPGGMNAGRIKLRISARARDYSFYVDTDGKGWKPLKEHEDGSILSTDVAGGFVGAMVGPYARAD